MKKVYSSKIGLELVIPLTLLLGTVLILIISEKQGWIGMLILFPVILFITHMFLTTNYTIEDGKLTIRCGFLMNKTIDVSTIKKIIESNNPLSSPAASLDRLEIIYGKRDSVLISPKRKKEFIDHILTLSPQIEVRLKKHPNNN